ncbi:hypothetical protein K474DRAFT_1770379 [Panus rudis PR-1116 ss-1]|nr:hypothetical protein K474DRAFT_1770379 [Panus rudis PR-1116 ss-1]
MAKTMDAATLQRKSRKEIQALAKKERIKANQKTEVIIRELIEIYARREEQSRANEESATKLASNEDTEPTEGNNASGDAVVAENVNEDNNDGVQIKGKANTTAESDQEEKESQQGNKQDMLQLFERFESRIPESSIRTAMGSEEDEAQYIESDKEEHAEPSTSPSREKADDELQSATQLVVHATAARCESPAPSGQSRSPEGVPARSASPISIGIRHGTYPYRGTASWYPYQNTTVYPRSLSLVTGRQPTLPSQPVVGSTSLPGPVRGSVIPPPSLYNHGPVYRSRGTTSPPSLTHNYGPPTAFLGIYGGMRRSPSPPVSPISDGMNGGMRRSPSPAVSSIRHSLPLSGRRPQDASSPATPSSDNEGHRATSPGSASSTNYSPASPLPIDLPVTFESFTAGIPTGEYASDESHDERTEPALESGQEREADELADENEDPRPVVEFDQGRLTTGSENHEDASSESSQYVGGNGQGPPAPEEDDDKENRPEGSQPSVVGPSEEASEEQTAITLGELRERLNIATVLVRSDGVVADKLREMQMLVDQECGRVKSVIKDIRDIQTIRLVLEKCVMSRLKVNPSLTNGESWRNEKEWRPTLTKNKKRRRTHEEPQTQDSRAEAESVPLTASARKRKLEQDEREVFGGSDDTISSTPPKRSQPSPAPAHAAKRGRYEGPEDEADDRWRT